MTRQEKHGWLIVASLFVALLAIAGSGYNTTRSLCLHSRRPSDGAAPGCRCCQAWPP